MASRASPSIRSKIGRGRFAEDFACRDFERRGFRLVARNLRAAREWGGGEIDLLMENEEGLWIIEVKSSPAAGLGIRPLLGAVQRARLRRAASWLRADRGVLVRCVLAWFDPEKQSLEIVENL